MDTKSRVVRFLMESLLAATSVIAAVRGYKRDFLTGQRETGRLGLMNASTDIRLDTLSTTEKLILMERLWVDLSVRPAEIRSPDWHGDVLSARLQAVQEGRTNFIDWEDAKRRLRERLK